MAWTERYVTADASGGGDGSLGTPWTLAEAATAAAGGNRVNIKAGTYNLGATVTFNNGSAENPIEWIGRTADWSSLMSVGRASATSALTVTNFPVISGSSAKFVQCGQYNHVKNIVITNTAASSTFRTAAYSTAFRCKFENTYTTSTTGAYAVQSNGGPFTFYDCDAVASAANTGQVILEGSNGSCVGCRVWHTSGTPYGIGISGPASVVGCVVFNCSVGVNNSYNVNMCSVYNCTTGVTLSATMGNVSDCVFATIGGYVIGGTSGGAPILNRVAYYAATSGIIDAGNLGSVIEHLNIVELSAAPFVDAAGGDFRLNATSGGGASCRGGSMLWDGHTDLGAVQHEDAGGGGILRRLARLIGG